LAERKDSDAGVLSGGERQMLVIGRALMLAPKMIMLDEPSLGLDPKFLQATYHRLVDLNKSGITILLVEQNVKKALEIVSEAHILNTGSIVMEGSAQKVMSQQDISEIYLGAKSGPKNRMRPRK
jgi:branched-chain amino acid transport system ATP-binding protein